MHEQGPYLFCEPVAKIKQTVPTAPEIKLETQIDVQWTNTKAKVHIMLIKEQDLHKEVWEKLAHIFFHLLGMVGGESWVFLLQQLKLSKSRTSVVITS